MLSQQSQEGLRNLAPGARRSGKSGARSGWFRVGMFSAALGAPLIARWNDLRTRQRLAALRDEANARMSNLSDLSANTQATIGDRLSDAREAARALVAQNQPRARAALESVRSATGSATDAARDLAQTTATQVAKGRAQLADALDTAARAVRAPVVAATTASDAAKKAAKRNARLNTTLWLAGIGVGVAVAGVAAYVIIRRRMTGATEEESLMELYGVEQGVLIPDDDAASTSTESGATAFAAQPTTQRADVTDMAAMSDMSDVMEDEADEPEAILVIQTEMDDETSEDALTGVPSAEDIADDEDDEDDYIDGPEATAHPAFIGNIHTMIYHPADADSLPALDNQVYFATEEQAIASGYRRTRRERVGAENGEDEDIAGK